MAPTADGYCAHFQVDPLRSDPTQNGVAAQAKEEALAEKLGATGLLRMRVVDVWPDSNPQWNATEGQPDLTATAGLSHARC